MVGVVPHRVCWKFVRPVLLDARKWYEPELPGFAKILTALNSVFMAGIKEKTDRGTRLPSSET